MKRLLLPAVLAFIVLTNSTLRAQDVPRYNPDDINIPYKKYTLPNGLRLLVHEDHKAPIVAVNVWYHVGAKNEKLGKSGFAHLFEHLMFNGSENFNTDYFQALEAIGNIDIDSIAETGELDHQEQLKAAMKSLEQQQKQLEIQQKQLKKQMKNLEKQEKQNQQTR